MLLSFVVPCYNEEGNVKNFYNDVNEKFCDVSYDYEFVFVNDGSKDKTINALRELVEIDEARVTVVNFSRNFGKEAAMYAGLKNAKGDLVSVIDADMQQDPDYVKEMVKRLDENPDIDCVAAYQDKRKESKLLTFFKNRFYRLINRASDVDFYQGASDFRTMRRNMVDAVVSMPEYFRFSKGLFAWVGFNTEYMPYDVKERGSGETTWSFWKLFKYAIEGIVSFTTAPLRIATTLGIVMAFLAIVYTVIILVQRLAFGVDVPGYASLIIIILVLGGTQLLTIGILGEYLARTFIQGKNRPVYIAREVLKSRKTEEGAAGASEGLEEK